MSRRKVLYGGERSLIQAIVSLLLCTLLTTAQGQLASVAQDSLLVSIGERELCGTYIVQQGDSTVSIAQKVGVTYEDLLAALQQCIDYKEGEFLQTGQIVCLPPYSPACESVRSVDNNPKCKSYTVQMGDTLARISTSLNLNTNDLLYLNNLNISDPVSPGQVLKLPPWGSSCQGGNSNSSADGSATVSQCQLYTVGPGETWTSIANKFQVSEDSIKSSNIDVSKEEPGVGYRLKIPIGEKGCDKIDIGRDCKMYISNGGETMEAVAKQTSLAVLQLLEINSRYKSPADVTEPGAQIKLPPWSSACGSNFTVINRPETSDSSETVKIPIVNETAMPPDMTGVAPFEAQPPVIDISPMENTQKPSATSTTNPSAEVTGEPSLAPETEIGKFIFDIFLGQMTQECFLQKQDNFIAVVANAANVSTENLVVRFALPTNSRPRRLLSSEMLKVSSLIMGEQNSIFQNLTSSFESGNFQSSMTESGFDMLYAQASYPAGQTTVFYTAPVDLQPDSPSQASSKISIGIIIAISAGTAVLILLAVIMCCALRSCRHSKAMENEMRRKVLKGPESSVSAYITPITPKKEKHGMMYSPKARGTLRYSHEPAITTPERIISEIPAINQSFVEALEVVNTSRDSSRPGSDCSSPNYNYPGNRHFNSTSIWVEHPSNPKVLQQSPNHVVSTSSLSERYFTRCTTPGKYHALTSSPSGRLERQSPRISTPTAFGITESKWAQRSPFSQRIPQDSDFDVLPRSSIKKKAALNPESTRQVPQGKSSKKLTPRKTLSNYIEL